METMLKSFEQENVMIMFYTYGKVEGEIGIIDVPKSSRMVFRMKEKQNPELLRLFVETAVQVSQKEKSHLCYTVVKADDHVLIQVLQENGFEWNKPEKADADTLTNEAQKELLFTKKIVLSEEDIIELPTAFDGIDCFVLWGTQGVSYKIGKGENVVIKKFHNGVFFEEVG